ncbi:MAG: NAD(P)/FAD-dependent oxidoreductase [Proteobacteria bacterium]|nr:NAD(P)/FAD-dependent oxidoreductase [Pseudomonadota bacterium]
MFQIEIKVPPEKDNLEFIKERLRNITGLKKDEITFFSIEKKSLDSRNKSSVHWIYRINFSASKVIRDTEGLNIKKVSDSKADYKPKITISQRKEKKVVVAGMGPAGIFCSLILALNNFEVLLIERGKAVEERVKDVEIFFKKGILNEESNIQFGEGGAGTFSDGKLTARTRYEFYDFIIKELISAGAPEEISYLYKPHIGTDKLRQVVTNLRKRLISLGVKISFNEKLIKPVINKERKVVSALTNERDIPCDALVLATGNASRDLYKGLFDENVLLEPKGFAMGFRIELSQKSIDKNQYGKKSYLLPPADFFLSRYFNEIKGSIYSFCMCPGGTIIPASSEKGGLVLNGMSNYKRDGHYGNAGLVISVSPKDWNNTLFGGIILQKEIEMKCYNAGKGGYRAPFCTTVDFVEKRIRTDNAPSSYPRGLTAYPLWEIYEDKYDFFKTALSDFDKKIKGIISDSTILIAPETRTSSPIRIKRDQNFMSVNTQFLFPCGEGAGYAGGIISSAVDGVKVAEKIIDILGR